MSSLNTVDGVAFTFILLFPDFEDNDINVESIVLPTRAFNDGSTYSFMMHIPVVANSYMLFWKAEGAKNGLIHSAQSTKTMVLERVGRPG